MEIFYLGKQIFYFLYIKTTENVLYLCILYRSGNKRGTLEYSLPFFDDYIREHMGE